MNRNTIVEAVFEIIRESTGWGMECNGKEYGNWIDGVVALADNLINKIDEKDCKVDTDQLRVIENIEDKVDGILQNGF